MFVERSDRVVKVADCGSTCRGFESALTPLVTYKRAFNKLSLKSDLPSRISRY